MGKAVGRGTHGSWDDVRCFWSLGDVDEFFAVEDDVAKIAPEVEIFRGGAMGSGLCAKEACG